MRQRLFNFGAACRRILLLLSFFLVATVAWLHWNGPDLDEFRPQIQSVIRSNLDLRQLSFGKLSWSWAGHVLIRANNLALVTNSDELHIEHATLVAQVAVWPLFSGRLQVRTLRILHPKVALQIPDHWDRTPSLSLMLVQIEDADITWHYGTDSGRIRNLDLSLDAHSRELLIRTSSFQGKLNWTRSHALQLLEWQWQDFDWLPKIFRPRMRGDIAGEIRIVRTKEGYLNSEAVISGEAGAALVNAHGTPLLAFDELHLLADLYWPESTDALQSIHFKKLSWQSGKNRLDLKGEWKRARMELQLQGGVLPLLSVEPWVRELGGKEWKAWLAGISAGMANHIRGNLNMDWPVLWKLPPLSYFEKAEFSLQAKVRDATLGLVPARGLAGQLTGVEGEIKIDQQGLEARVSKAVLPRHSGSVRGLFRISDWKQIAFDVKGHAHVDMGSLLAWQGVKTIDDLQWLKAPASGDFEFSWMPEESTPRRGHAHLTPGSSWDLSYRGLAFSMREGTLDLDIKEGLKLRKMRVSSAPWTGILDMAVVRQDHRKPVLQSLNLNIRADLAALTQTFKIPIVNPGGLAKGSVNFNGSWVVNIDFQDASWDRWLGASKRQGQPFSSSATVEIKADSFKLNNLISTGSIMSFHGYGEYGPDKRFILLEQLKTPAIDARVRLAEPGKDEPLELTIDGKYLTNKFLPESTPVSSDLQGRKILVRLFLEQLNWGSASLSGVQAKITMPGRGVDHLSAKLMNVADLNISDVHVAFRRKSANELDVHRLSARLWGQKVFISAMVSRQPEGGLRWDGFARMQSDDFSQLVTQLHWSHRLQGGKLRALFAGHGTLISGMPWWKDLSGRLRLRVDGGRILSGGTLTKFLSAANIADLPKLLIAARKDLLGPGIYYKRLQVESHLTGKKASLEKVVLRSAAFDMAGRGEMDIQSGSVDLIAIIQPFQNLDAILGAIPLVRDLFRGGIMRKIYHVHGPFSEATVDSISPEDARFSSPDIWKELREMPNRWFGKGEAGKQ